MSWLQGRDSSIKPLEWTGPHLLSAPPPHSPGLPLRGSAQVTALPSLSKDRQTIVEALRGSRTPADARVLKTAVNGLAIRTPEHPADRAPRHRIERITVWMIAATSTFTALLIVFSRFRPVPEKRIDCSTGLLQLLLGGVAGFALKRSR